MYSDPEGTILITAALITATLITTAKAMAIGFVFGAIIGGGFEIGKQIHNNGWDLTNLSWSQIGLSALGGGVAGAISSIPTGSSFLGYAISLLTGGSGSLLGGIISGSVTDIQSGAFAFGIGAVANVMAKGISDLIKKGITSSAQKKFDRPLFYDLKVSDLIGTGHNNNGLNHIYQNTLDLASKYVINSFWGKSLAYAIINSSLSGTFSGWY